MTTTLAGKPVTAFTLTIPRVGLWSAEVEVDDDTVLTGDVDLVVEGRTWRGTVHRGGVELARGHWRIVGAGALLAVLGPQAFRSTTLADVLRETVLGAGASLAADLGDLTASVAAWHRRSGPATHTLADVASAAGYAWRSLSDGTLWCGADAWASQALPASDVELLDVAPAMGRHELAGTAALDVLPGRTVALDGADVRVGLVEHRQHGAALRTVVWSERDADVGAGAGRLRAALAAMIRAETRRVDYYALYPATVVTQDGAGGPLDLRPDSEAIAPPQAVPLRTLPGVKLTIPAGTRVLLGYEGGDPRRPYAALAEFADVTRLAVNGSTTKAARDGESTENGTLVIAAASSGVPPISTLTFTYTPPQGPPQVMTISGLLGAAVAGGVTPIVVSGRVAGGSDVVRIP